MLAWPTVPLPFYPLNLAPIREGAPGLQDGSTLVLLAVIGVVILLGLALTTLRFRKQVVAVEFDEVDTSAVLEAEVLDAIDLDEALALELPQKENATAGAATSRG